MDSSMSMPNVSQRLLVIHPRFRAISGSKSIWVLKQDLTFLELLFTSTKKKRENSILEYSRAGASTAKVLFDDPWKIFNNQFKI
jgi:hypothetical protein